MSRHSNDGEAPGHMQDRESFEYFFPSLTASLGYSKTVSLLLRAPTCLVMVDWAETFSQKAAALSDS